MKKNLNRTDRRFVNHSSVRRIRISHPITVLLASGATVGLIGCGYHRAAGPSGAGGTAVAGGNAASPGAVRIASLGGANQSGGGNQSGERGTMVTRSARQFDPFWIEAAADADKQIWMGNPAFAESGGAMGGGTILAKQTGELARAHGAMGAGAADTVEGLTHVTFAGEGADFDPCISRDGAFMVFASTQHRATADVYLKKVDGRTITQLTSDAGHDLMPSISPDGKRVAFASNRTGNWDVYVMSTSGGQAVQLTGDSSQEVAPSWSADGTRIAFSRFGEMSGRWEMWVMDVNASASAEFLGYGLFPKWCPKAMTAGSGRDKILFQRSRERGDRAFSLWTIDYKPGDASSPTEVASSSGTALINADWSPDGERIVYASVENPGGPGGCGEGLSGNGRPAISDLWMANIDGSGRVNLTNGKFMNLMPTWGKDGRIYFVSNRSGLTNVWSVGTEKAIFAASGVGVKGRTEVADAPEQGAGNSER